MHEDAFNTPETHTLALQINGTLSLFRLQKEAKRLSKIEDSPRRIVDIQTLLCNCQELEYRTLDLHLPSAEIPHGCGISPEIAARSHSANQSSNRPCNPVSVYKDAAGPGLIREANTHRTKRIMIHTIILQCIEWLYAAGFPDYPGRMSFAQVASRAISVLREMVDGICSTVPLKLQVAQHKLARKIPHRGLSQSATKLHQLKSHETMDGYLIIGPLLAAFRAPCLEKRQRNVISEAIAAITSEVGIDSSQAERVLKNMDALIFKSSYVDSQLGAGEDIAAAAPFSIV